MRTLILTVCLWSPPAIAFAVFCSVAPQGIPCTPVPGPETDAAKKYIMKILQDAQDAEATVGKYKAEYFAVRGSAASDEEKLDACRKYFAAFTAQEQLYQQAMSETARLYQVNPKEKRVTIAAPSDKESNYVTGLSALWNPRVTDSGPGVMLSVRIDGSDGRPHYSGTAMMDPSAPRGLQAVTLADGRVLVLKGTFDHVLEKNNPGFLARILYHETRHFDRLAWLDENLKPHGWQNTDMEERDAYARDVRIGKVFGLKKEEIDELRKNHADYAEAVRTGIPLSDSRLTPHQEAFWKSHYDNSQINLEEEFVSLSSNVNSERKRQEALRKQLDQERLAREEADRERRALEAEQQRDAIAAQCGYQTTFQGNTGILLGFKSADQYLFFNMPYKTRINMDDLRIFMLVARACNEVDKNTNNPSPRACNDSADTLRAIVAQPGFEAKLDYMFGQRSRRSACINHMFDQGVAITDTSSFDKAVYLYHKELIRLRIEYDKRWNRNSPSRDDRARESHREPRRDDERESPDHDEVRRRLGGQFRP